MADDAVLAVAQLRVVGWSFRVRDAPGLQPAPVGARLTLERDAGNAHDANAIRVRHAGADIGFLERLAAKEAAPLLFDSRAAAAALCLEARCIAFSARSGHDLRLEIREAPGVGVPAELYDSVVTFAGRFAPPSAQLREQPGADGWVRMPRGLDARAWALANKPSSFSAAEVAWLYAAGPPARSAQSPRVGKWQLFVAPASQDELWLTVLVALIEGRLGCGAKTAPPAAEQRSSVVIVYTSDWEDRSDVLRVALELLKIVPKTKMLCYKTDAHTIQGVYADNGPTSLFKIKPGEAQLTVDETVLAQARAMVEPDRGGAAQQQAPRVRPFSGAGRTLGAAAAAPEVVSLLSDSDDDAPPAPPPPKAAKTAAGASRTAAAQKAADAIQPFLRADSGAAAGGAACTSTLGIELIGSWAGMPPVAVARWLLEGASPSERVTTARACSGELRMRDVAARMPTGDAYAGARCTKIQQNETAPPSPASAQKPKAELASPRAAGGNTLLANLHAERAARQRGT